MRFNFLVSRKSLVSPKTTTYYEVSFGHNQNNQAIRHQSELRLIKNALEYLPKSEIKQVPRQTRGIYVLCRQRKPLNGRRKRFDVVYVGMARRGIAGRLRSERGEWL
jgi:hypothetical protein